MSVESILRALAEQSGRAGRARGSVIGNTISSLSQVPGQIMDDRRQLAERQRAEAIRNEQLGLQRNADVRAGAADTRAQHDQDAQDAAGAATIKRQEALRAGIAAGFGGKSDPKDFDEPAAIKAVTDAGFPDLAPTIVETHRKFQPEKPKLTPNVDTSKSVIDDTGKVVIAGVPEVKPIIPEAVGSFGDYLKAPPERRKEIEAARKSYMQADDRPRVDVRVEGGPAGTGALSPEGVEYAATMMRVTGKMPPMGMGNSEARAAIINETAKQAKELRQTPVVALQKQAAYAGDSKALAKMQSMQAAAASFENKAVAQAEIVRDLSEKVGRTQIPLLNKAILDGKRDIIGDADTQLYFNAITTFSTEYAKIMEGSTGSAAASSDSARKAASELVKASLNKATMQKTLDLMQKEMRLSIQGYDATIDHITERMGGTPAAPVVTMPTPSGISYQDYLESRKPPK